MICEVCQSDNLRVESSVQRCDKMDVRRVTCRECGNSYITVTKMTDIIVNGEQVPLNQAGSHIKNLWEKFVDNRLKSPRLFES